MAASTSVFTGPPTGGFYTVGDTVTDANGVVWQAVTTGFAGQNDSGTAHFDAVNVPATIGVGTPAALSTVSVAESGVGAVHKTVITLTALAQTIPNGASEFVGTELYAFPAGRIYLLGTTASLTPTTTSALATTITSGTTGHYAMGSVTNDGTLTGTKADIFADTSFTSSTTVNVAAAAVTPVGAAAVIASPGSVFLNTSAAVNSADGTMTTTGTITMHWINLG